MNRSVLLRLLPASRTGARLAGTAEVVDTGERQSFRDADDLVALLHRLHVEHPDGAGIDIVGPGAEPPGAPAS